MEKLIEKDRSFLSIEGIIRLGLYIFYFMFGYLNKHAETIISFIRLFKKFKIYFPKKIKILFEICVDNS